ncbi:unnamed protein product [Soboliphyme baturini]|uniref:Protein quiver n=1 Tax=Soboliphyme baturini TaxID=241478 RepID=A0A183IY48_9BILA|nr:unnamed protein product [Soboliphyme baturini]
MLLRLLLAVRTPGVSAQAKSMCAKAFNVGVALVGVDDGQFGRDKPAIQSTYPAKRLGIKVDNSFIRGCADSLFITERKGFIPEVMTRTVNLCRTLPRNRLFSEERGNELVSLCICAFDRCNVHPDKLFPSTSASCRCRRCRHRYYSERLLPLHVLLAGSLLAFVV